jgi:hypothetical protein
MTDQSIPKIVNEPTNNDIYMATYMATSANPGGSDGNFQADFPNHKPPCLMFRDFRFPRKKLAEGKLRDDAPSYPS